MFFDIKLVLKGKVSARPSLAGQCWVRDVNSLECVKSLMLARGWTQNLTLTIIDIAKRLYAKGKIPYCNSINVAVACLEKENAFPLDSDCTDTPCRSACLRPINDAHEACAFYCQIRPSTTSPPTPTQGTTSLPLRDPTDILTTRGLDGIASDINRNKLLTTNEILFTQTSLSYLREPER